MITTDLYKRAIKAYGETHQVGVSIEELSELITVLSRKHLRGRGEDSEVLSEIADVCIMIEQLKIIYGADRVSTMTFKKLEKLRKHVERKEKENDA